MYVDFLFVCSIIYIFLCGSVKMHSKSFVISDVYKMKTNISINIFDMHTQIHKHK